MVILLYNSDRKDRVKMTIRGRMKIVLKNLTKVYPQEKHAPAVTAVNHFNFEIPDGKLVALLGPSGCGKSTTLNMICGLETPTEGKIYFGDEDITNVPVENRDVGMVFQSYALYPHLTVKQNIMFPLENKKGKDKLSKQVIEEKAKEVAKLVQIDTLMDRKPSALSGGQQQRVAIARALVKQPKVLLLDEPLSNLDARLRLSTREEIRRIQKETGITTVFVTHDQEEAMSISDLMVVMKDGVLQQIAKPQEIYDDPKNLFVAKFLGTPAINVLSGKIRNGKLVIGSDSVSDVLLPDQDVYVGIRPEGLVIDENGPFVCTLRNIEKLGRDTSVICMHEGMQSDHLRVIVPSETEITKSEEIRFSLKKNKVYLFDQEEKRISFGEQA